MKVQPTPTSPKVRSAENVQALEELYRNEGLQQLHKPGTRTKGISLATVILSVVLGFVAGVLGSLVASVYLTSDAPWVSRFLGVSLPADTIATPARHQTKTLALTTEQALDANESLLALYDARSGASPAQSTYFAADQIGSALLLTDDGWAVAVRSALGDNADHVAVTSDRKVLRVKTIIRDPASDLVFFRIDGTRYTPLPLDGEETPSQFDSYYVIAGNGQQQYARTLPVTFEDVRAQIGPGLESSDMVTSGYRTNTTLPNAFLGGAVVDRQGTGVGIILASGETTIVLPASAIRQVLASVLREQKASRPSLGVYSIDLARGAGIPESLRSRRTTGAYVTGTTDALAVEPRSAAAAAGLRSGDVVIKVAGRLLDETLGLSDVIRTFSPGQSVDIIVVRDGEEKTVTATLGILTSSQ